MELRNEGSSALLRPVSLSAFSHGELLYFPVCNNKALISLPSSHSWSRSLRVCRLTSLTLISSAYLHRNRCTVKYLYLSHVISAKPGDAALYTSLDQVLMTRTMLGVPSDVEGSGLPTQADWRSCSEGLEVFCNRYIIVFWWHNVTFSVFLGSDVFFYVCAFFSLHKVALWD